MRKKAKYDMREYMKEMYREYLIRNGDVNNILNSTSHKARAQAEYCRDNSLPHFAPGSGRCWSCGKQIYDRIDFSQAANSLITGCPFCHRSYCS